MATHLLVGSFRAQLDGEEYPATARARIDVAKQVLRLIVP